VQRKPSTCQRKMLVGLRPFVRVGSSILPAPDWDEAVLN
jgi:hypothetical protein